MADGYLKNMTEKKKKKKRTFLEFIADNVLGTTDENVKRYKGKAGSYLERKESKQKRLDRIFEDEYK